MREIGAGDLDMTLEFPMDILDSGSTIFVRDAYTHLLHKIAWLWNNTVVSRGMPNQKLLHNNWYSATKTC